MNSIYTRIGLVFTLLAFVLVFTTDPADAAIYKCRNSKGQIEFKQTPCSGESLKMFNEKGKKLRVGKAGLSYVTNSITANETIMPVDTAIAVYFKQKGKINLFFSMRKLSNTELAQLKNDNATRLMMGMASPDIEKWKKHPSADIDIYFKPNKPHTPENIANIDFHFVNITKEPKQDNLEFGGEKVIDTFQKFDFKLDGDRSKMVIDFVDQKQVSDVDYQWSLSFEIPVIMAN